MPITLAKLSAAGLLLLGLLGSTGPAPENPFAVASQAARQGPAGGFNYLLPLLELRRLRPAYLRDPANQELLGTYWQAAATYASLADEADSAAYYWYQQPGYGGGPPAGPAPPPPVLPPAGPALLARAARSQVVMFNEAHTQPGGRWLVGSLLPALWRQGFRYLALEALAAADSAGVRRRGYPVVGSGFYTNEPHFGNLIRRARQLGFRVVAYESEAPDREQGQARNLLAVTGLPASGARVVVLAGHGHINEDPAAASLARWVQRLAGLDPLTIDQTQAALNDVPAWRALPPGAYLVAPPAAPAWPLRCDLYVLNRLRLAEAGNSFGDAAGRPVALAAPPDSLPPPQPHLLLVYARAEKQARPDAEPVALRYLAPGQTTARFALLPGTYTLEVRDAHGRRRWQQPLPVQ